jgi:hypothetical protein
MKNLILFFTMLIFLASCKTLQTGMLDTNNRYHFKDYRFVVTYSYALNMYRDYVVSDTIHMYRNGCVQYAYDNEGTPDTVIRCGTYQIEKTNQKGFTAIDEKVYPIY